MPDISNLHLLSSNQTLELVEGAERVNIEAIGDAAVALRGKAHILGLRKNEAFNTGFATVEGVGESRRILLTVGDFSLVRVIIIDALEVAGSCKPEVALFANNIATSRLSFSFFAVRYFKTFCLINAHRVSIGAFNAKRFPTKRYAV